MRMEFRRLVGTILDVRSWPTHGVTSADLRKQAAAMLRSFYDSDEFAFWPKKQFFQKAPEEVRIVDSAGDVVARYDICDLIADMGHQLVGNRYA